MLRAAKSQMGYFLAKSQNIELKQLKNVFFVNGLFGPDFIIFYLNVNIWDRESQRVHNPKPGSILARNKVNYRGYYCFLRLESGKNVS